MAANDPEILEEFTRLVESGAFVALEVTVIEWGGTPHTPSGGWIEVARLPLDMPVEQRELRRRKLLQNRRFFGLCHMCQMRQPRGWMHGSRVCQGCAQRELGVVY